jgi:hypothetical protein
MRLRSVLSAVALAILTVSMNTSSLFAQAPVDRPAELRSGTCDALGSVVASLANLVLTEGQQQGQMGATPVEQSGTVVPLLLSDLLATDHALVVQRSPQDLSSVACGVIGGALNPDGTLAIGMSGVNGSGLSGVAYFTPIIEFDNLLITILLTGGETTAPTTVEAPVETEAVAEVPADTGETAVAANEAGLTKEVVYENPANIVVSTNEGNSGSSGNPVVEEEENANQ